MAKNHWIRLITGLSLVSASYADAVVYHDVDRPFSYELFTSEIFSWIDGTRSGRVTDTMGDISSGLKKVIDSTGRHAEIAIYGLRKQQWFLDSLKALKQRKNVKTSIVVDQRQGAVGEWDPENFDYPDTAKLPALLGDGLVKPDTDSRGNVNVNAIMHNKFAVIDRRKVWLGSANVSHTDAGSEYNANIAILIKNPEIARIYSDEFRQMFKDSRFSSQKTAREDKRPIRFADGTIADVFFSPQDDPMNRAVLDFIQRAKRSIDISMFFLTDTKAATALKHAVKRGVKVRLIYDALAAAHAASKHSWLRDQGVDVRVENWGGKMHMKTAVADNTDVILGSLNWSASGSMKNDENTIIVRGNRRLGSEVAGYFARLWSTLEPGKGKRFRYPRAEGVESINSCHDGIDNDHDGAVDGDDEGCAAEIP